MYDETNIQQLVRRAWDEARPIDMRHLGEHDRVLVSKAIADLIEAISPRLKKRTGRRQYVVIVRDHHQLRIELRVPEGWLHSSSRS
jgi:hypothetical protein